MLYFTLIFPASALLAIASAIFCGIRYGRSSFEFQLCLLSLACLLLSYLAGFVSLSLHPYWIDNNAEELMSLSERWFWAVLDASFF